MADSPESPPTKPATKPAATPAPAPAAQAKTTAAEPKTATKPPAPEKKKMRFFKKWLITVGVSLLVAAGAYGAGWFQGSAGTGNLEAIAEAATRDARLLEARRRLDLAHVALENQNFGIAEAHLRAAALKLDAAELTGPMEAFAREVAEMRIGVAGDIAVQQRRLRELIDRFDQLHPPASEPSATPAASVE